MMSDAYHIGPMIHNPIDDHVIFITTPETLVSNSDAFPLSTFEIA